MEGSPSGRRRLSRRYKSPTQLVLAACARLAVRWRERTFGVTSRRCPSPSPGCRTAQVASTQPEEFSASILVFNVRFGVVANGISRDL
jgi:hypothetical protein